MQAQRRRPGISAFRVALSLLAAITAVSARGEERPPCATTIPELRALVGDPAFPLHWQETSMSDGKPMLVSIIERNGALFLEFFKSSESLWAEGSGVICLRGVHLETHLAADKLRMGPSANMLARLALSNGGTFTLKRLAARELHIDTTGWSGHFVPAPRR